jgi:hypothetical protein
MATLPTRELEQEPFGPLTVQARNEACEVVNAGVRNKEGCILWTNTDEEQRQACAPVLKLGQRLHPLQYTLEEWIDQENKQKNTNAKWLSI